MSIFYLRSIFIIIFLSIKQKTNNRKDSKSYSITTHTYTQNKIFNNHQYIKTTINKLKTIIKIVNEIKSTLGTML